MMPAEKVVDLAATLDVMFSDMVNRNIREQNLTPEEGAAVKILLAGVIAGRAENAVADDPTALNVYETGKSIGTEMSVAMLGAQTETKQ